jgi:hypothetical protein
VRYVVNQCHGYPRQPNLPSISDSLGPSMTLLVSEWWSQDIQSLNERGTSHVAPLMKWSQPAGSYCRNVPCDNTGGVLERWGSLKGRRERDRGERKEDVGLDIAFRLPPLYCMPFCRVQESSNVMYLVKGVHINLHTRLSLSVLLQLLHFRLPIEFRIKAQHFPSLLDANQTLPRILGFGGVIDVWEDLLDELSGRGGECDIGVCDVEYVSPLEVTFCCQSECLGTVSSVNVTESATLSARIDDGNCHISDGGGESETSSLPWSDHWTSRAVCLHTHIWNMEKGYGNELTSKLEMRDRSGIWGTLRSRRATSHY